AFAPNAMNDYVSVGGARQTFDSNGNLTSDGSRQFFYDWANRLVRVADSAGAEIVQYSYDGLGRRIRKRVGGVTIRLLYSEARIIEEQNENGGVLRQYVYGTGIDEVLQLRVGGKEYFCHDNSLGSVVALTDSSGGVVERYRYSEFGETTVLGADNAAVLGQSIAGNPM